MGGDWSQARETKSLRVHVSYPQHTAGWGDKRACHLFPTTMHSLTHSFIPSVSQYYREHAVCYVLF